MYKGEKFNSISHLIGALLACAGVSFLLAVAIDKGDLYKIVGFSIYGAMMIALYAISTIYHSTKGHVKNFFRQMDYISIYLMIAGSYTPISLVILHGVWGWTIFGIIWGLAVIGIIQEIILGKKTRKYSIILYVVMGWLIVIAIDPLVHSLPLKGLLWLIAGGLSYTFGIVFFLLDEKYKHFHGIWHICVIAGSVFQFICLYWYVA
jgi:hemolysin III